MIRSTPGVAIRRRRSQPEALNLPSQPPSTRCQKGRFTTVTHPRCSRSSTAAQDCDCSVCAWCGATDPAPVSPHPAPSVAFAVDLGSAHHSAHAWSHAPSGGLRSVLTQPQRADCAPDHRLGGCPMTGWYGARDHVCKRRHTAHLLLRTERKSRPNAPQPPSRQMLRMSPLHASDGVFRPILTLGV